MLFVPNEAAICTGWSCYLFQSQHSFVCMFWFQCLMAFRLNFVLFCEWMTSFKSSIFGGLSSVDPFLHLLLVSKFQGFEFFHAYFDWELFRAHYLIVKCRFIEFSTFCRLIAIQTIWEWIMRERKRMDKWERRRVEKQRKILWFWEKKAEKQRNGQNKGGRDRRRQKTDSRKQIMRKRHRNTEKEKPIIAINAKIIPTRSHRLSWTWNKMLIGI